jgi:serine/threonine-protein kinase
VKEAVSILIQIAQGIEAAHNNHIIHRDIKPQNIIISKEGKVKVTDFGIARAASTNTISSNAMGSVHYISPEQAKGGFIDEKSDIYSLGITLYEMITGRVPFEGDSTVSIALQHVQNELPSPKLYVQDLPISVEKIIEKCTQKKPDRRYLKVSSLIADLKKSLISPDEDFVQIVQLDENGATRMISDEEVSRIRKESGFERQELEIPVIGKDNEVLEPEDDEDEDIRDDLGEELEDEDNPKLDKIIAIGGIVTAVIIVIIVAFVIISFLGNGCSSSSGHKETSSSEETLDANHTRVPDVAGCTQEEAIEKLAEATLGYKIQTENDSKVAEGYVIRTSVDAGEVVEKNTTITLVISSGAKSVEVPDVTGDDKETARQKLKDLNLNVKIEYKADNSAEIDKVLGTEPEAYKTMKEGEDIILYVSSGSDSTDVTVPKLTGLSRDAAQASLESQGLTLGEVSETYSDDQKAGLVAKQDIEANSKVPSGTVVNIWLSKGPEEKPKVPNLVGKSKSEAEQLLKDAGLSGNAKTANSDSVASGYVISQETNADTTVEKGATITYTVSSGPKEKVTEAPTTTAATVAQEKTVETTISKNNLYISDGVTEGELSYVISVTLNNGNTVTYPSVSLGNLSSFSAYSIKDKVEANADSATITVSLETSDGLKVVGIINETPR